MFHLAPFSMFFIYIVVNLYFDPNVSCVPSGSSPHPDLRGPSVPSSPSCTPSTPTMLCSGNSEPNLNTPLNINLNSSLNSNYQTAFSSSTGLSKWSSCLFFIFFSCLFRFPKVLLLSQQSSFLQYFIFNMYTIVSFCTETAQEQNSQHAC